MAGAGIEEFLKRRAEDGLLRQLCPAASRRNGMLSFGGREYIDFSSNDYLGLSHDPRLIAEAAKALETWGVSSSASRLMSGDLDIHHQLETKTAAFKKKEAALVFNSGYQANVGILSALYGKSDCIFADRLCHASIIDGVLLSGARLFRFRHNDAGHARVLIEKERNKFRNALIVTESIFSMEGDRAPLDELVGLKERYDCAMMADEAHATGIFGAGGSGVVEDDGLSARIDLIMGTFSKALGGFGGYLAASRATIDYLVNACRSFIYSTALPPSVIACNALSIDIVRKESFRRIQLLENARFLRDGLRQQGFEVRGCSQIVPVMTGETKRTAACAQRLREKGYRVLPIRPPTVPENSARLRLSLTAFHTEEILQRFINDLGDIAF